MPRAAVSCNRFGCPNLQPCPLHAKKPWETSNRKSLSGSKQAKRRLYILRRDHGICHVCGEGGSDQADHIIPLAEGGPDTTQNMGAIHAKPCHEHKTLEEARRGRERALRT